MTEEEGIPKQTANLCVETGQVIHSRKPRAKESRSRNIPRSIAPLTAAQRCRLYRVRKKTRLVEELVANEGFLPHSRKQIALSNNLPRHLISPKPAYWEELELTRLEKFRVLNREIKIMRRKKKFTLYYRNKVQPTIIPEVTESPSFDRYPSSPESELIEKGRSMRCGI